MKFNIENPDLAFAIFNFVVDKKFDDWSILREVHNLSMAEFVNEYCKEEFKSYCTDCLGIVFS